MVPGLSSVLSMSGFIVMVRGLGCGQSSDAAGGPQQAGSSPGTLATLGGLGSSMTSSLHTLSSTTQAKIARAKALEAEQVKAAEEAVAKEKKARETNLEADIADAKAAAKHNTSLCSRLLKPRWMQLITSSSSSVRRRRMR